MLSEQSCTKCKTIKPASEFYLKPSRRGGISSQCRVCTRVRVNNYQKNILRAVGRRKYNHGVDEDTQYAMLARQDYSCAACRAPITIETAQLDHNHRTGKIRGFLCTHCNRALGFAKDDIDILYSLINYLESNGE